MDKRRQLLAKNSWLLITEIGNEDSWVSTGKIVGEIHGCSLLKSVMNIQRHVLAD